MFKFLFCLLLIIVVVPVRSDNYENCRTPRYNEAGQCVPVKLCSVFIEQLHKTKTDAFYQYLNKSLCSFTKLKSYVCCAARHIIEDIEDSTTTEKPSPSTITPVTIKPVRPTLPNVCGIVNSDRISNANKTELNEYPWMALLQYQATSGLEFKCGGSLITKRYVLTAAHCVNGADELVSVRLGEHDINTVKDCDKREGYCSPPVQDIGIEEIIPHSDYQRRNFKNDIALIRLNKEANIEENVKIICLPISQEFETIEHKTAIVSGWGYTEESNKLSNELLQAELPVVSNSVCQNLYKSRITLSNSQLCAGGKNYVDSCYGDSGGPLFTQSTINEKFPLYYQIGIVSAGISKCGEMNSYTIFTSVTFYIDWILDNLKS